jgi:hypothetical protein
MKRALIATLFLLQAALLHAEEPLWRFDTHG